MRWQILPEGTTAKMSVWQNLALAGVAILAGLGALAILTYHRP